MDVNFNPKMLGIAEGEVFKDVHYFFLILKTPFPSKKSVFCYFLPWLFFKKTKFAISVHTLSPSYKSPRYFFRKRAANKKE